MRHYRLYVLALALLLLSACGTTLPSTTAPTGRTANGTGNASEPTAQTPTTSDTPNATLSPGASATNTPSPTTRPPAPPHAPTAKRAPTPTPRPPAKPTTSGTVQTVWETFYAALDNDPAGSSAIAYPAPQGIHTHAGGIGTYANPITLAADARWLRIGTRVYAPRWHKYFIMEDECVECEADWASSHFHHVDLYMSSSVRSAVLACEDAATKDQAENDIIILNPDPNRPVDTTPLYTDTGGCVQAAHQY